MSSLPFLGTQFDLNTIGQILTVFVIANSFFSAVTTLTMERTATTRWRGRLWVTLILLWAALVLPLIELLLGAPPIIEVVDGVAISN
ncbi:MAG: hypothetical protein JRN20_13850, partial [Nitrososphaerota archaeon]|nr:hypothetical protein [Nitrososphaerota archaeon]